MNDTPRTSRPLLLALLLLALVALSGRVDFQTARLPPLPDIASTVNPFRVLGGLATELGSQTTMLPRFDALPPAPVPGRDTLWLTVPGRMLSGEEIAGLQAWVAAGGRLVLAPLTPRLWEKDPLLAALGLQLSKATSETVDARLGDPQTRPSVWRHGLLYEFSDDTVVRAAFRPEQGIRPLADDDARGEPLLCDPVSCHGWRLELGDGEVIALAESWPFNNASIAAHDHAAIAARLIGAAPGHRLVIVYGEEVPSLFALLRAHTGFALLALAAAVLLWILAAGLRFGPLHATPVAARRRLGEHVAASGLWLARNGHRQRLWQAVHDDFRRTLHRRHPQAHGMDDAALVALIARHAGIDPQQVRAALAVPAADIDDATLARQVRRLDSLRRLL